MTGFFSDVRYATRLLMKNPAFTTVPVAIGAAAIPGRRATRIEPMQALREE